jgi:hypothetical protein
MSDEIKKPEGVNAEEQKQLDEKGLDQVVGGVTTITNVPTTAGWKPNQPSRD